MKTSASIESWVKQVESGNVKSQCGTISAHLLTGPKSTYELSLLLGVKVNTVSARISQLEEMGFVVGCDYKYHDKTKYSVYRITRDQLEQERVIKEVKESKCKRDLNRLVSGSYSTILSPGFLQRVQAELSRMSALSMIALLLIVSIFMSSCVTTKGFPAIDKSELLDTVLDSLYTPYSYMATVTDVYDGDSYTLMVDQGLGHWCEIKNRLADVDTPELHGAERTQGLKVRDYVSDLLLNQVVVIVTDEDKTGKYGRLLTWVYFLDDKSDRWVNLGMHLLQKQYATKY